MLTLISETSVVGVDVALISGNIIRIDVCDDKRGCKEEKVQWSV